MTRQLRAVAALTLKTLERCERQSLGDEIMNLRAFSRTPDAERGLSAAVRAELLDQGSWRNVLEGYARATKLAVMMVDVSGTALGPCVGPRQIWQLVTECASSTDRCPFCLHPESNCQALDDARRTGQIAFARDRAGLAHSVVPVRLAGQPIAFLLAGQVFDSFPEQLLLDDLARKTKCAPHAAMGTRETRGSRRSHGVTGLR